MNHLQSFALFEIRKVRDYRHADSAPDSYKFAHQTDRAAEAKIRLQVAPIFLWCHRAITKMAVRYNSETEGRGINVQKLEDYDPYNPTLDFNSEFEYEEDGYAFTFSAGGSRFFIKRVEGKLTVANVKGEQLVFAPREFEQELHQLVQRNIPHFNALLDNEGDILAQPLDSEEF